MGKGKQGHVPQPPAPVPYCLLQVFLRIIIPLHFLTEHAKALCGLSLGKALNWKRQHFQRWNRPVTEDKGNWNGVIIKTWWIAANKAGNSSTESWFGSRISLLYLDKSPTALQGNTASLLSCSIYTTELNHVSTCLGPTGTMHIEEMLYNLLTNHRTWNR